MSDSFVQAAYGLVPTLLGALGTGVMWLAKTVYKAKCDIDIAHCKIRALEEKLEDLEDDIGAFNS